MRVETILGFDALLVVACTTLVLVLRYSRLWLALCVAFLIRAGSALFHIYVLPLPDSQRDAVAFEALAREWAQQGVATAFAHYTSDAYFYSWFLSLIYALATPSALMAQAWSILAGIGSAFVAWQLARELWDDRSAQKAVWWLGLFPTLVLYSSITMREPFVVFFLLLGLCGVARWRCNGKIRSIFEAIGCFTVATFFHGAMFVAILAFVVLLVLRHGQTCLLALQNGRLRMISLSLFLVLIVVGSLYVMVGFTVPKLGAFEHMVDSERLIRMFRNFSIGDASYPAWLLPNSSLEIFLKAPFRIAYFLFSPFPWDVRKPSHLIGLIDGMLYLFLAFLLWRQRKVIWANPAARSIMFILFCLVVVFGVAAGNFGTALRHRSKFVAVAIILVAPLLPRFVVQRRKTQLL